ncbi:MAG: hypothetical protein JWQ96_874 [Segetibacter sp.]|nr:hypothetical protein [Segetibacter sp.]
MITTKPTDINEYIASFPKNVQEVMQQVRETIKKAAPGAEEGIGYAIPVFKLNKTYVVYFAGYKNHIGLYPAPTGMEAFKQDFVGYKTGKGSVQFPLDKPMPLDLIMKIVKFRVKEAMEKTAKKK